jgi:pimeloyl-ACP methyl ester carboxylesterase
MRYKRKWLSALIVLALALSGCQPAQPEDQLHPKVASTASLQPDLDESALDSDFVTTDPVAMRKRYEDAISLFDYDQAPLHLLAQGSELELFEGTVNRYELSYASPRGGRVPATLLVPDTSEPKPAVLFLHGLPGSRHDTLGIAEVFARAGVVTLSIDAPFARRSVNRPPMTFTRGDRHDQIQLIVDLRRAVDLLVSRDDVDPAHIGFYGTSYGAAMGGILAGVEPRIAAFVLEVGDGGLVEHFTGPDDADGRLSKLAVARRSRWIRLMETIEPLYFVGYAAPAELLFQNGLNDELVSQSDGLRYQIAGSEPKDTRWYQAGHDLNLAAKCEAAAWLGERLSFSLAAFDACPPH